MKERRMSFRGARRARRTHKYEHHRYVREQGAMVRQLSLEEQAAMAARIDRIKRERDSPPTRASFNPWTR